jgi:hypothetical protein
MALGEDQMVVAGVVRPVEGVAQMVRQQDGHQIRRRHRRRGVARTGGVGGPYGVHAKLLAHLAQLIVIHVELSPVRTGNEYPPDLRPTPHGATAPAVVDPPSGGQNREPKFDAPQIPVRLRPPNEGGVG